MPLNIYIPDHIVAVLDPPELARVRAIMGSHRRETIDTLPPGPRSVVLSIVRDARLLKGARNANRRMIFEKLRPDNIEQRDREVRPFFNNSTRGKSNDRCNQIV
jgi:hypothetical protein